MRSHNNEHWDSLPTIDVASLKHMAYVFDALIYFARSLTESTDTDILRHTANNDPWDAQVTLVCSLIFHIC